MITTAQLAGLVLDHMATHALPEPSSVTMVRYGGRGISIQIDGVGLTEKSRTLLRWACSLPASTVHAWRPADCDVVHLEVETALTDAVSLLVYGGTPFDPDLFADLEPGARRPVTLGQLTEWASGTEAAA